MMSIVLILTCALVSVADGSSIFDEDLYHKVLDSELCDLQLKTIDATEFYDASFRAPQSLLGGNFIDYGNYHQCLAIRQDFPSISIEGKYCVIEARFASPTLKIPSLGGASASDNFTWTEWALNWSRDEILQYYTRYAGSDIEISKTALSSSETSPVIRSVTVSLGVCVPKACTADAVLRPYAEHPLLKFNYTEKFCRLPDDKPLVAADFTAYTILSIFGVLTIISTVYELRHTLILKKDPATANELFRVCSVYSNTRQLLTFSGSPRSLNCLDGIRTLSVLWIILYHSYLMIVTTHMNKLQMVQELFSRKYTWFYSGTIAVDTFFALSGLLLVYTAAHKLNRKTLLSSLHMFYLNRYVRLFPHLATAVMLYSSLLFHIADGPNWNAISGSVTSCRKSWWVTLLYVQNIVDADWCLGHAWYLTVDYQLYLVAPLVLYWALGGTGGALGERAAWCALGAAVAASLGATLALCFHYNYPSWNHDGLIVEYYSYYCNVVTRSPPFFIGMVGGYALHVFRERKVPLPKWSVFLCHGVALLMSASVIYVSELIVQVNWDNQLVVNLKNSLMRATWAVSLCWLIFACSQGYGGPVNWFLSLPLWRLPARLSYAMYLYSLPLQSILTCSSPTQYYYDTRALLSVFATSVVWSAAAAATASVLLEAPLIALYTLLLKRIRSKPNTTQ